MKELIIETEIYILKLCSENNYKITINYILNVKCDLKINNESILAFSINYNNYEYLYNLKIINNIPLFSIKLKNNINKQIVLKDKYDFNKLIVAMNNDKKNND